MVLAITGLTFGYYVVNNAFLGAGAPGAIDADSRQSAILRLDGETADRRPQANTWRTRRRYPESERAAAAFITLRRKPRRIF